MWKHEGFFALYKGFWPNWLRLGTWNIIVSFWNMRMKVNASSSQVILGYRKENLIIEAFRQVRIYSSILMVTTVGGTKYRNGFQLESNTN